MSHTMLGNITPETFLSDYWQKKPLLIRNAVSHFDWLPQLQDLLALAQDEDVESRLVEFKKEQWHCETGPFKPSRFKKLGETDWTVLVQNVNHHIPFADELLHRINFIPKVRLDDLMISWAPPGGGVGPHFDSYDVFLLQVGGKKRWQISHSSDLELVEGAPLKILKHFEPDEEWVLEHGDMLYLPPRFPHNGVSIEAGMTWSIGFRAPKTQEVATQFMDYLRDKITDLPGMYADPDLKATSEPARMPADFVAQIKTMLEQVKWDDAMIAEFAGRYFSEPKQHVFYDMPEEEHDHASFAKRVEQVGARLDLKTVLLYDDVKFYINGDDFTPEPESFEVLRTLANARHLPPARYSQPVIDALFTCYDFGYVQIGEFADEESAR
ncbi:cupin domain-containing protein [Burkholderiaceae bacterium DAT-1]|nr:cupin domain-containing protein [Burkholderiaceae bacterium DAT-1]